MSFANTHTPTKPTKKAKWQVPTRPGKNNYSTVYYLEGELKQKFCELFPKHSNRRIMQWFGIGFSTMQRFKRELNLEKDMTAIRKELARDVKRICEKNGWYDSLRGQPVSEACREAARKKHAEGFHPLKRLKENNPRKYKRLIKRWTEDRRKLRESDRRRMVFGLEPKTKLVKANPIGRKATVQKYEMLKDNNYFSVPEHPDWVCYDSETRRSARREATAIKYGLRIVEGE